MVMPMPRAGRAGIQRVVDLRKVGVHHQLEVLDAAGIGEAVAPLVQAAGAVAGAQLHGLARRELDGGGHQPGFLIGGQIGDGGIGDEVKLEVFQSDGVAR